MTTEITITTPALSLPIAVRDAFNAIMAAVQTPIVDVTTHHGAGVALRSVKGHLKTINDHRMSITRPLDDEKRRIMDFFQPFIDGLADAEKQLKSGIMKYEREEEERRRAAEELIRRAQAEAAEAARAEAEAKMAAGDVAGAVESIFDANVLEAPIAPSQAPKLSGIGRATTYTWELEKPGGMEKLVRAALANPQAYARYVTVDSVAIGRDVRAQGASFNVPGIAVTAVEGLRARA